MKFTDIQFSNIVRKNDKNVNLHCLWQARAAPVYLIKSFSRVQIYLFCVKEYFQIYKKNTSKFSNPFPKRTCFAIIYLTTAKAEKRKG